MRGKGKGGLKGKKGKNLHMVDAFAAWKGKGKSKLKQSRPAVNAYASETFYGMEMQPASDLQSTSTASLKPGCALIDCGATASAGPEESVKGLISSILAVDKGASVSIAYMRPFFRFGNGKWGQTTREPSPPMLVALLEVFTCIAFQTLMMYPNLVSTRTHWFQFCWVWIT